MQSCGAVSSVGACCGSTIMKALMVLGVIGWVCMAIKLVFVLQDTAGLIAQDNVSILHAKSPKVHGGSCSMFY